jgi:hypothetical protein
MKKGILQTHLLALTLLLLFLGPSLSESKEVQGPLTIPHDLVTLGALEAPIEKVLDRLSREGDFRCYIFPEMKGNRISARFRNRRPQEVLEELLGDNHIVKYRDNGEISAVYVLDNKDEKLADRNRRVKSYLENAFFSLPVLKDIVRESLKQDYPTAKEFLVIPREDIKGELNGYVFSYYIGSGPAPTVDRVRLEAASDWESRRRSVNQTKEAASMNDATDTPTEQAPFLGAHKSMRRSHEFLTVEVSADFSSPPIRKFQLGLPDDLTMYPAAEDLLAKRGRLSSQVKFIRTFMLSPLAVGFEFRDSPSRQSYYVDVLRRQVFVSYGQRLKAKIKRRLLDPERDSRIERQWLELLSY